jgi:hypothetical protein
LRQTGVDAFVHSELHEKRGYVCGRERHFRRFGTLDRQEPTVPKTSRRHNFQVLDSSWASNGGSGASLATRHEGTKKSRKAEIHRNARAPNKAGTDSQGSIAIDANPRNEPFL